MKRLFIYTISILFTGLLSINAQDKGDQIVGIRGGFHSAGLVKDGEKPDTANSLNNFYVGFFREKQIAPLFYWGSGLEYFQNGIKYSNSSKRVLHTISIPVNLKLKLGPIYGLGGAAANFMVSEKIVIGDNSSTPDDSNKSNWFDVPVYVGAGVKILFVSVEARYHWGLIDIKKGYYNRYFQLGAALSF